MTARTSHDPEAGAFHARFAPGGVAVEGTEQGGPSATVDFDANGDAVGIGVLNVSERGRKAAPASDKPAAAE